MARAVAFGLFFGIAFDVAVGEHVEQDKLGRVFGAVYAPLGLADIAASGASGWLVEATSPTAVFLVAGSGGWRWRG
jgi:hypothetical protein